MTVHKGTMDVRNRVFSSNTLEWEPQSTGSGGGPGGGSTQVSIKEILSSSGGSIIDSSIVGIRVNVVAGSAAGDTTATVTPAAGSTFFTMPKSTAWASSAGFHFDSSGGLVVEQESTIWAVQVDGRVRAQNSTIGDLLASVQQNSSVWQIQAGSTNWPKAAGLSVDSSNVQNVKLDGSTAITIGSIAAAAGRINIGSTAADNAVVCSSMSSLAGRVTVAPTDTNFASSAGFHFNSSGALVVDLTGGASTILQIRGDRASTATSSNSTQSSTNFTMLAGNANRNGFTCFNQPTQGANLHLKWGATASTSSFNVRIPPFGYYEMPSPIYQGQIDAIWDSTGVGRAQVTELLI